MTRTLLLLSLASLALGGCADYLNHRDTVSFGAGDAVAWNRAAHEVDPWNRDAAATRIVSDGEAVEAAYPRRLLVGPPVNASAPTAATVVAN